MLKRCKGLLVICAIIMFMSSARPAAASSLTQGVYTDEDARYLKSVMDMVKRKYNGEVTDRQLVEGALRGMMDTMDPYTVYFSNEEAESFFGEMEGSYEGIGITMEEQGGYVKIAGVMPGSPAERAGLSVGDMLVEADGIDIRGMSMEEVGGIIKGNSGTSITLGIIKSVEGNIERIKVGRETIKMDPGIFNIDEDIGYIKLNIFNSNSADFINRALEFMDKKGITKLILDLRDNPGGEVLQAVEIAENFVPEGLITRLDFKAPEEDDVKYFSTLEKVRYKLVLLVNENTASASEILAGAVQDTKSGTIVGTRTFGKARVQSIIPILTPEASKKYEAELGVRVVDAQDLYYIYKIEPSYDEILGWTKITTGEYYTPKGRMIDKKGIVPDVEIDGLDYEGYVEKLPSSGKNAAEPSEEDVFTAETMMKLLGYKISKPDMVFDEETVEAVKSFQRDMKIGQTGILDDVTRVMLNKKLSTALRLIDLQYMKAAEILKGQSSEG